MVSFWRIETNSEKISAMLKAMLHNRDILAGPGDFDRPTLLTRTPVLRTVPQMFSGSCKPSSGKASTSFVARTMRSGLGSSGKAIVVL